MELTKWRRNLSNLVQQLRGDYARRAVTMTGCFLAGLAAARGLVFGKYAPFGVAVAAAAPRGGLWAGAMGAFLGYLLPSPAYVPVRYAAALVAVTAIRWSLDQLKSVNGHPLFSPAAAFLPLLLTGMTMVFLQGSVTYTAAQYVAESFLGAGSAYFLRRVVYLLSGLTGEGKPRIGAVGGRLESGDLAAVTVSLGVLLLSFSGVSVMGVSLGRILLVLLVLYCARAAGISGGAVAGVAAGAIQGLSTAGLSYLSGAYGLGGLMAGVFAPMGKVAGAAAFIIAHGVASLQVGAGSTQILTGAVEVAAATIVYMFLPRSRRFTEIFGLRGDSLSGGALRGNIVMRLKYAAQALTQVSVSVEEIAKKLQNVCAPTLRGVYDRSTETICAGCGMSTVCWRKYKDQTLRNFAQLSGPLKEKEKLETCDFTKEFSDRCCRAGEMRDELNKNYARYLMKEAAELRTAQVREVVEAHFRTTAGILEELAGEFAQYQRFDEEAAQRVAVVLRDSGVTPLEVCCRVDRFDRMTVEAEIGRERQKRLNRAAFTREVSSACGRLFSPPCVSAGEDRCRIQMCQRPLLDVGRGFSQTCAGGGAFCGDSTNVFYDGCGRLIAVLSDGMGTGGRAAVDGAMTSAMAESLLKAGVGFDSMLETDRKSVV